MKNLSPAHATMAPMEREMADGEYAKSAGAAADYDSMDEDFGGAAPMSEPPLGALAAPASPVTTTPTAGPGVSRGEPAVEEPRNDPGGRLIIYTAAMRVAVFNLDEAMDNAEALPERFGGYVHSMASGEIVLKIPARRLREAMKELADYGVVEQRSLSTQDVGAEYVDMQSRIRALESTHKQLLELLSKARTVDEALHVRAALDQVTGELEVLKGRMRQLDSLIAFSTLTLSMYERGPNTPVPSSNDPFPWVDSLGVEATEWK
jgi:hypothetical protein